MFKAKEKSVLESSGSTMIVKTGLLIVSNPRHIGKILPSMKKYVNNTLYIQLLSAPTDSFGSFYPNIFNVWPKFTHTIKGIYSQAANHCENLDIRILVSGLKYKNLKYIETSRPIDVVIFDKQHSEQDIDNFIQEKIRSIAKKYTVLTTDTGVVEEPICDTQIDTQVYKHTVLGGTFDRLHVAHKLLLTEAVLRATEKVTVGVTAENMLESKTLWELVEPLDKRIYDVKDFLDDIDSEIEKNIVPITDAFGPTKDDPTMDAIIVSDETLRGGNKVNVVRSNNGLKPLQIHSVGLIDEPQPGANEESKISSSTSRIRLLGTLLKPVEPNKMIDEKPYIIGLTGSIASGKSNVAQRLKELGAFVIDCDKIAHYVYQPGKPCHEQLVSAFGNTILSENGEINRKVVGAIVFKDPKELQKLNSLVWPAIVEEVQKRIKETTAEVVVIEAAILLVAGWDKYCHEIWATFTSEKEAVKRLQERNGFTEEEAKSRLLSQWSTKKYVEHANVVICSNWAADYTREVIDKAWRLLHTRIHS